MRISKKHDVRLNEILDAAALLFMQKGYEQVTINDILERVEIGKGTFYYYFKSKEEVMNAVIGRMVESVAAAANTIAEDKTMSAHDKMRNIILSLNISQSPNAPMIEELHQPSNAQMHQQSIVETIKGVAPILADVVRQGISEGVYQTDYSLETVEFLLAANQFIFDAGIFHWSLEEIKARTVAFAHITESVLGAPDGSFAFLLEAIAPQNLQNEEDGTDAE